MIVSILLALLFMYAGGSKMLDFENFQVQLAQSPLLSAYAGFISFAVIIVEFILAICLCLPNTQKMALYGALGLMSAFTFYIYIILHYSDFIPCSCGGILEKLGWTEHLIFNLFFVFLSFVAILYKERKENPNAKLFRPVWIAIASVAISSGVVLVLFLRSEHIIKKENNFTRRFLQHPIFGDKIIDLGVNSYYFAGIADGSIYLGNATTPLYVTKVDTALKTLNRTKITLDNIDHPFRNVQLKVKSPYYYLYDGNVPVIYRGRLGDSIAQTISYGDAFFNQLSVLDSMKFALRTQKRTDKQYTIALLDLMKNPKTELKPAILEKQIDGVFDVDGVLSAEPTTGNLVYTYFYRNQYIVMDANLNVLNRFNTIDTTKRAEISVTRLSDGRTKMNAPPFSVNNGFTVYDDLIFNRSNLKGKHEPSSSWKNSSIIDVYSTDEQRYIGSFYIRNKKDKAMSSMITDGRYMYVLVGNELQRYRIRDGAFKFDKKRNRWFKEAPVDEDIKGIAENPVTD
ncbi:MauE/DoxX family redox-associated membrane protein [Sphingobacterium athyrii]|nr:MauE/DoxX family redox-associated membrane protein [Sphingobacterium athyrii]